jgi:uncharacterized protein YjbI with pentapeptide repeats
VLKHWVAWPRGRRWLICGIAVVILALAVAWVLLVPAADWLARHDVGPVTGPLRSLRLQTARDAARGRLLTLCAGLLALGALIFTALNFDLLRRNSQRNYEQAEQGQVTDRYTKAIEQLGSDRLDVRIGGIYALERIARDSARDHPTVIEVLSALVREHSREPWRRPSDDDDPGADPHERKTRPDVQAAASVIGRRTHTHDGQPVNLAHADLTGADLALTNLAHTRFTGATLASTRLTSANLTGALMHGAVLSNARLHGADLSNARLNEANLAHAYLYDANLAGSMLTEATLTWADLKDARLSGADLTAARLARAYLNQADLTGADLTGADLTGADLTSADLTDADLTNADLARSTDFTGAKLNRAIWPRNAVVPEGWDRDTEGRLRRADADPPESATS